MSSSGVFKLSGIVAIMVFLTGSYASAGWFDKKPAQEQPKPTKEQSRPTQSTQQTPPPPKLTGSLKDKSPSTVAWDLTSFAEKGDYDKVKQYLKEGADPNCKSGMAKQSVLYWAADNGHVKIVQLLLDKGAIPNVDICDDVRSPVKAAINHHTKQGTLECLKLLIKKGADVKVDCGEEESFLFYAADRGNLQAVEMFLSMGFGINAMDKKQNKTPLMAAAASSHKEIVKFLLAKGADPNIMNSGGDTALSLTGDNSIGEMLIARGANRSKWCCKKLDSYLYSFTIDNPDYAKETRKDFLEKCPELAALLKQDLDSYGYSLGLSLTVKRSEREVAENVKKSIERRCKEWERSK